MLRTPSHFFPWGEKTVEIVLNPEISQWRSDKQPDQQLVDDIKKKGLLENLVARRLPDGRLELLAGERRYRAMQSLGITDEDIQKQMKILENISNDEAVLIALSENQYRKDLSPIEEGRAFKSFQKLSRLPVSDIAVKVGRSETYVRDRLALIELPAKIQDKISEGKIEISYAKPLLRLSKYPKSQMALAHKIVTEHWEIKTVEDADQITDKFLEEIKQRKKIADKYGPCPKCGSQNISPGSWSDKEQLKCEDCQYTWHRETKDPWKVHELKREAQKLGLKLEVKGDDGAELTPSAVEKIIEDHRKAEKPITTFRSKHSLAEILAPFLEDDNLLSFRAEGDELRIKLVQDSSLHFSVRKHKYETGEKCRIKIIMSYWDESEGAKTQQAENVKRFIETLSLKTD